MAMMIIVLKKVNEDYDDRHHDENGDGVHLWYQLDYHLYISIHPIL